jgi:hypothetical protein
VRAGAFGATLLALVLPAAAQRPAVRPYPVHRGITATVFWIGEPKGNGSSESNAVSAWDDAWLAHYGGVDDPWTRRTAADGYFPTRFTPGENPFYVDLPYSDFDDRGDPRPDRASVVPWAADYASEVRAFRAHGRPFSLVKNRWVMLRRGHRVCYAQWEDAGPYRYDDARYVFGSGAVRPASRLARRAGIDVSPAVRDCLAFAGLNNDENRLDWQFVEASQVPPGPWDRVVTTRQVYWP